MNLLHELEQRINVLPVLSIQTLAVLLASVRLLLIVLALVIVLDSLVNVLNAVMVEVPRLVFEQHMRALTLDVVVWQVLELQNDILQRVQLVLVGLEEFVDFGLVVNSHDEQHKHNELIAENIYIYNPISPRRQNQR